MLYFFPLMRGVSSSSTRHRRIGEPVCCSTAGRRVESSVHATQVWNGDQNLWFRSRRSQEAPHTTGRTSEPPYPSVKGYVQRVSEYYTKKRTVTTRLGYEDPPAAYDVASSGRSTLSHQHPPDCARRGGDVLTPGRRGRWAQEPAIANDDRVCRTSGVSRRKESIQVRRRTEQRGHESLQERQQQQQQHQ